MAGGAKTYGNIEDRDVFLAYATAGPDDLTRKPANNERAAGSEKQKAQARA
jgi:hypothetical protein